MAVTFSPTKSTSEASAFGLVIIPDGSQWYWHWYDEAGNRYDCDFGFNRIDDCFKCAIDWALSEAPAEICLHVCEMAGSA